MNHYESYLTAMIYKAQPKSYIGDVLKLFKLLNVSSISSI